MVFYMTDFLLLMLSAGVVSLGSSLSVLLFPRGKECLSQSVLAGSNDDDSFQLRLGQWPYLALQLQGLSVAGAMAADLEMFFVSRPILSCLTKFCLHQLMLCR
jgi:hypothetical protein